MAARSSGSRSERIAREQRELQRVLSAQLSAMWAQYERTGYPARDDDFPAVAAFYWQAEGEFIRRAPGDRSRGFLYAGKRYGWETTNIGRLWVVDWDTRKQLVCGPPCAV